MISQMEFFFFFPKGSFFPPPSSLCLLAAGACVFLTLLSTPRCLFTPFSGLLQSKVVGWQSIGAYDKAPPFVTNDLVVLPGSSKGILIDRIHSAFP